MTQQGNAGGLASHFRFSKKTKGRDLGRKTRLAPQQSADSKQQHRDTDEADGAQQHRADAARRRRARYAHSKRHHFQNETTTENQTHPPPQKTDANRFAFVFSKRNTYSYAQKTGKYNAPKHISP